MKSPRRERERERRKKVRVRKMKWTEGKGNEEEELRITFWIEEKQARWMSEWIRKREKERNRERKKYVWESKDVCLIKVMKRASFELKESFFLFPVSLSLSWSNLVSFVTSYTLSGYLHCHHPFFILPFLSPFISLFNVLFSLDAFSLS